MALTVTSFNNKVIWSPLPLSTSKFCCSSSSSSSSSTTQLQLSLSPLKTPFKQIENSGVIACLRANSADLAMNAARAAISGGISVLEIVMSTPGVFEVLQCLVQDHPTMTLGVGTVLTVEDAKNAINAGAKFLMSPATVKGIMDDIQGQEDLYIPGVMTPTEILSAYDAGAKIVKVYPVSALGGIQYISALKKPFPHIPMVASQGITIDSIRDYIAQGATAVVLSEAIFNKEAMAQNNFDAIYQLAALAALQGKEAVQCQDNMQEEKVHARLIALDVVNTFHPYHLTWTAVKVTRIIYLLWKKHSDAASESGPEKFLHTHGKSQEHHCHSAWRKKSMQIAQSAKVSLDKDE